LLAPENDVASAEGLRVVMPVRTIDFGPLLGSTTSYQSVETLTHSADWYRVFVCAPPRPLPF
jgi:hypothetical protein